jgi:hypothetical protein
MSEAVATNLASGREKKPFAANHRWDRNFFLLLVLSMWLGILVGFGWDVIDHLGTQRYAYPAYRLQDPGLSGLKVDELLDPLRNEPRFREIERKLRIPA